MRNTILTVILLVGSADASVQKTQRPVTEAPALAAWRESLHDSGTLKAYLEKKLWGENDVMYEGWTPWDLAIWFREEAGDLSDAQVRAALVEIYSAAEARGDVGSRELMTRAALWLGVCSDSETKEFLLGVAVDATKDDSLRTTAVASYLRSADAQEAKEILTQLLIGKEKMSVMSCFPLYQYAQVAWNETSSEEKKAAIAATLYMALSEETLPWVFRVGDEILQGMSPGYTASRERLALLERALARPFPERRERTKRELESRLEEMRRLKVLTSVSTNLAALKVLDFNQPLPEDERIALMTPPEARQADNTPQEEPPRTGRTGLYALGGAAAVVLASAVVWVSRRRRGASRP